MANPSPLGPITLLGIIISLFTVLQIYYNVLIQLQKYGSQLRSSPESKQIRGNSNREYFKVLERTGETGTTEKMKKHYKNNEELIMTSKMIKTTLNTIRKKEKIKNNSNKQTD